MHYSADARIDRCTRQPMRGSTTPRRMTPDLRAARTPPADQRPIVPVKNPARWRPRSPLSGAADAVERDCCGAPASVDLALAPRVRIDRESSVSGYRRARCGRLRSCHACVERPAPEHSANTTEAPRPPVRRAPSRRTRQGRPRGASLSAVARRTRADGQRHHLRGGAASRRC